MNPLLGALLIFLLRIGDVSIGTLRVMYMVRGERFKAVSLGLAESLIWVVAIAQVMGNGHDPDEGFGQAE